MKEELTAEQKISNLKIKLQSEILELKNSQIRRINNKSETIFNMLKNKAGDTTETAYTLILERENWIQLVKFFKELKDDNFTDFESDSNWVETERELKMKIDFLKQL